MTGLLASGQDDIVEEKNPDLDKTAVQSEASSQLNEKNTSSNDPYGETDDQHHVDVAGAKAEFEKLRRTLSRQSREIGAAEGGDGDDYEEFDLREYLVRFRHDLYPMTQ